MHGFARPLLLLLLLWLLLADSSRSARCVCVYYKFRYEYVWVYMRHSVLGIFLKSVRVSVALHVLRCMLLRSPVRFSIARYIVLAFRTLANTAHTHTEHTYSDGKERRVLRLIRIGYTNDFSRLILLSLVVCCRCMAWFVSLWLWAIQAADSSGVAALEWWCVLVCVRVAWHIKMLWYVDVFGHSMWLGVRLPYNTHFNEWIGMHAIPISLSERLLHHLGSFVYSVISIHILYVYQIDVDGNNCN